MHAHKSSHYDVIIVGGGLVGASLALALRDTRLSVALIDARLPSADDARLFALNISSVNLLKRLGVWETIAAHASPIKTVHVSHRGHFGALRLSATEAGLPVLGEVMPACHLEAAMHAALMQVTHHTVLRPARVTALSVNDGVTTLSVDHEGDVISLSAALVIGADGTESTLRALTNIPTETIDYHQTAIVTRFQLSREQHGVAYERFCDGGALAMLPLPHQQCASILSVKTELANDLMVASDEAYLAHCQTIMGHRLGRLLSMEKRHAFPLRMKRATQAVAGSVYLLGNALHTLHPIAAQGFNLALYEVACLAEGIAEQCQRGVTITPHDLQTMSQQTEKQQRVSTFVSDKLARLFARPLPGVSLLAGLGMAGLDCLPPLKKHFINRMIGRVGALPTLLASNQE